jgi:hypothetical protein
MWTLQHLKAADKNFLICRPALNKEAKVRTHEGLGTNTK